MTKIPPGYALVRLDDLTALYAAQPGRPRRQAPPPAPSPQPASATMAGVAEAVSLLAARVHGIDNPGLSGDVPAPSVTAALAIIACAALAELLPADRGARLLADLGHTAAREAST